MRRLEDLRGQADAVLRLRSAIRADRLHHALLFAGPDGVGKFLAAKLLAAELSGRLSVLGPGHPDVHILEPNEKGRITVDEIREAAATLHLRPLEAPSRLLIIRDADVMLHQAQNALLKTLEEPPGRAKLILTSARPRSFLATILSRCQRVEFRPVPQPELEQVLEAHGMEPGRAALIAALSQGSPGRALAVDAERVIAARDRVASLDLEIGAGATAAALAEARSLGEDKEMLPERLELLAVWLRDQILLSSGAGVAIANRDRQSELERLASERGLVGVLARARALEEARGLLDEPYNYNPQMIVESMCLSFAGPPRSHP